MMKKLWMPLVIPAMLLALSINAGAVLVDSLVDEPFAPDGAGSFNVTVTSEVSLNAPGAGYHYTYQITSTDVQLTWFAIALLDNNTTNYDPGVGSNVPDLWQYVDPLGAKAVFFTDPVNAGQMSAILSFDSMDAPTTTTAKLTGIVSGSLSGNVLAPVPEPATMAMLALGSMGMLMRRKRN